MEEIKKRIDKFININYEGRDNALEVIKIFGEIEEEEKAKIAGVLEKASDYFSQFSKASRVEFEEVTLDPANMKLKVREKGKEEPRDANTLSSAELDMLYFSVRIALAEKLLQDETGFFILDDAFVKESNEALEILFDMVRDISEAGWQILYFTAKGDVLNELASDIDSGVVQEIPVSGVEA